MKFLCSNCKAKYQIPDEKIAGRTLKMDCRRCATPIVIRGDLGIPDDVADGPETQDASRSAPSRAGAAVPAAAAAASSTARRPAAGSATARPIGAAAGGSSVGPHPTASARGSATGRGALGADFRRNVAAAEPPRAVTPLDQWHVAINDVPVGPMKRDEISRKISAGAVTGDSLAWREGFDDWRPLREIPELAALMRRATSESDVSSPRGGPRATAPRAAAPRPGASATGTARPIATSARPAAARSNVVAIGGRLGASAAPAIDTDELHDASDGGDAEPTTVASAADLGLDLASLAPKSKAAPIAKSEPAPEPEVMRAEPAKPAKQPSGPFKHAAPPASAAPSPLAVPPRPEVKAQPEAPKVEAKRPSFAPPPPAAPIVDVAPSAPTVGPKPAPVAAAPVVAAPQQQRQGMSVGALMGIGFAMAAGAVLMYGVVQRFLLTPPTPDAPVATATVAPTAPEAQHVAEVEVDPTTLPTTPTPTAPEATAPTAETTPTTETAEAPAHRPSSSTGGHSATKAPSTSPATTASSPTTSTPSSTGSARFDQFADSPSGSGPAPIATTATQSGSHASSDSASGPRTELTEAQISEVRRREQRSLQTCWETAIRGMRDVGDVRMDIDITIGASGTVMSARARGPGVGSLSECIEQRVRRWHFPASSDTTQLTFPVVFSGQ